MTPALNYIVDHAEMALIVPLLATAVVVIYRVCASRPWGLVDMVLLGVPLPLALTYTAALGRAKTVPGESLFDELVFRFSGVLLFAPQVVILYPIGIAVWVYVIKHGCPSCGTPTSVLALSATVLVTALGHFWTKATLGAL